MQGRSIAPVTMRFYRDFNILIERHEKAQKALDGKLPEIAAQYLRYIRLTDSKQIGRLDLFQAALFHKRVDLEDKLRLDEMLLRIRHAEILENISSAGFVSFFANGPTPLQSVRPSTNRCLISCMSRRGVSRPVFDFFWKA
jgi:hypothetical protein